MQTKTRPREPRMRFTIKPKALPKGMHPAYIKAAIEEKGSSQTLLSGDLGCSQEAVGNVIYGRMTSFRIASAIAELTEIPLNTLWPGRYQALDDSKS